MRSLPTVLHGALQAQEMLEARFPLAWFIVHMHVIEADTPDFSATSMDKEI